MARAWYRLPSGEDPTIQAGASLGRAFELRATALLVRGLRARLVVERLLGGHAGGPVELRGVGPEWWAAATALGVRVTGEALADLSGGIPDPGLAAPTPATRALSSLAAAVRPRTPPVVTFVGSPIWSDPYRAVVASRWPTQLVDPGRRALASALVGGPRLSPRWVSVRPIVPLPADEQVSEAADPSLTLVQRSFRWARPRLAAAAAAGATLGGQLAIATQDVSPAIRALLLGSRAAGGRVLTLEHGIAGGYDHQVHSVGDALGVWGRPQAEYHRAVGTRGIRIEEIGWARLEAQFRRRLPPPRFDVVYFGQPALPLSAASWPEDALRADALIDAYAAARAGRLVAAKPHPATRAYLGSTAPFTSARIVTDDSLDLIARSRVVVTRRSTTAVEAMALGRAVVLIDPLGSIGAWDLLAGAEDIAHATCLEELDGAVETLLTDVAASRRAIDAGFDFVRAFIRGIDAPGSARSALADVVSSLLQGAG
jgi:hypothetical protein